MICKSPIAFVTLTYDQLVELTLGYLLPKTWVTSHDSLQHVLTWLFNAKWTPRQYVKYLVIHFSELLELIHLGFSWPELNRGIFTLGAYVLWYLSTFINFVKQWWPSGLASQSIANSILKVEGTNPPTSIMKLVFTNSQTVCFGIELTSSFGCVICTKYWRDN